MANAKKCDRCGGFYEFGDIGVSKGGSYVTGISFTRRNNSPIEAMDLCKECIDKLKCFIDGAEIIWED